MSVVLAIFVAAAAGAQEPMCGNRRIDLVEVGERECPPCIPGQPCRCTEPDARPVEQCDGRDLGGASCRSVGFLGGGTLRCGADCTFDTSRCRASTPALRPIEQPWGEGHTSEEPIGLATSAGVLAVAWSAGRSIRLQRFSARLRRLGESTPLATPLHARPFLFSTADGFLLALTAPEGRALTSGTGAPRTTIHRVDAGGTIGPETTAFDGFAVEGGATGDSGVLLLLSRPRNDLASLEAVMLGADGLARSPPLLLLPHARTTQRVGALAVGGGWLVARSTGDNGGYSGITVVRIEGDGRVAAAPGLDGLPGAPRAMQPHLAADAGGALLHYYVDGTRHVIALDAAGRPTGAPATLPTGTGYVIAALGRDLAVATADPLLHLVRGAAVAPLVSVPDAFGVAAAPFAGGIAVAWAHVSRGRGPRLSLALVRR